MTRRDFLASLSSAAAPRRPNIVLIVADDLGFSDLGCYGGEIRTPNLDRMAAEGTRYSQFYNCAVCVATRASLLTGLHPRFGGERLRPGMRTVAETLRNAGYRTAMSGKWHLGAQEPNRPVDRGFEEYYGVMSGSCNYFDPSIPSPFTKGRAGHGFVHNDRKVSSFPDGYYTTDAFSRHAASEIRRQARSDRPFFLHLAYTAPHFPLQARAEDIAKYRGRYRRGYEVLRRQRYERMRRIGLIRDGWGLPAVDRRLGEFRYDYQVAAWRSEPDRDREQRLMEIYAAMVDRMDFGIGLVMEALRETGADSNTIVLFLSDNGGCASLPLPEEMPAYHAYNRGRILGGRDSYLFCGPGWATAQSAPFRRYKTWTYEGGITTPFIVRWPAKVPANVWRHEPAHVADLLPTLAELGGARYEGSPALEGRSLVSAFQGGSAGGTREFGWFLYGNRAYREGPWKAVWGATNFRWELFNMDEDRTETHDLASREPERLARLTRRWEEWAGTTGAPATGTPADWNVY
ncbi:MAG: arylsulfatase [Bryobacterales bacterium]|nr:arylsulfatase [Bryobacterales bacterium]